MENQNENSSEERTETPSAFRREEFRKKGMVAVSRELLSVGILLAVGLGLYLTLHLIFRSWSLMAESFFAFKVSGLFEKATLLELGLSSTKAMAHMILPAFGISFLAAFLFNASQAGFHFSWESISPSWDRLDPVKGMGRIWSKKGLIEGVKALLKFALVLAILLYFLKGSLPYFSESSMGDVGGSTAIMLRLLAKLFFGLLGVLVILAVIDYGFTRFRFEKQLRMTKQEAKEEFKLREGDPLIKSRIRRIQRKMASKRMMEEVPKADVVITNPTHFAVALKYDSEVMMAPKVVAKGADWLALKIKELAKDHQVAVVENKPLARSLYKDLDIGDYIPRDLYKAVAEVLALVYRLKNATKTT